MKLHIETPGVNGRQCKFSVINYELKTLTMMNVVESTGVDMQAHDVAMHETDDKLCGIRTKLAIPMRRLRS